MNKSLLGLKLRDPSLALFSAALVFVFLALTTARNIGLFDEGELAVAAYELGLGHPVGQPLHTLLGALFSRLPFVSPVYGLELLSALATALTVIPAFALVERVLAEDSRRFIAPLSVLCVMLHGLVWEHSTRIEVYPLAVLFSSLAVAHAAAQTSPRIVGLCLGLSASANPVIALFGAIASLGVAPLPKNSRLHFTKELAFGVALGLLPYLQFAIAAMRPHAFVWGGLSSFEELAHYLSGRDYRGNLSAPLGTRFSQLRELSLYLALDRGGLTMFAATLLGLVALSVRSARLALTSLLSLALPLFFVSSNAIFAVDVPDYLGYLASGLVLAAMPIACALDEAFRRARVGGVLVLALVAGAIVSSPFLFGRSRASDDITASFAHELLEEAPRGAILVLESDHFVAPLLYAQRVERERPDVVVVIRGLMSSSWYLRMLAKQHPSLEAYAERGSGGRDGRIRRLLDANHDRPIRLEHLGLAQSLGLRACASGLSFAVGDRCANAALDLGPVMRILLRASRLPSGALDAARVAPRVALRLALDLERLGQNRAAYTLLVASLPDSMRGTFLPAPTSITEQRPLLTADPVFSRRRSLGEPAQNAFVAARMLADAGQVDAAIELTRRAAHEGLPEAVELLSRASAER